MKNVYDGWSVQFIAGLEFMKALDEAKFEHPVYILRSTRVLNRLRSGIFELHHNAGGIDVTMVCRDALYAYFRGRCVGNEAMDFLIASMRSVCTALRIAENVYDLEGLNFCLLTIQGKDDEDLPYFHRLFHPALMLYRLQDAYHLAGLRGGKPLHPPFDEAMFIASVFKERNPLASNTAVAKHVKSELKVKYSRTPAERTIREWLQKF